MLDIAQAYRISLDFLFDIGRLGTKVYECKFFACYFVDGAIFLNPGAITKIEQYETKKMNNHKCLLLPVDDPDINFNRY